MIEKTGKPGKTGTTETDIEVLRRMLRWRTRRGMWEVELVLHRWLDVYLNQLSVAQIEQMFQLFEYSDTDLYDYLCKGMVPENAQMAQLTQTIASFAPDIDSA